MSTAGKYGPGVIGAAAFEVEKGLAERGAIKYGPGVTGPGSPPVAEVADLVPLVPDSGTASEPPFDHAPEIPPRTFVPVDELEDVLAAQPELFDALLADELNRPDGARRAAAWIFQKVEQGRPAPRSEVLDALALVLV